MRPIVVCVLAAVLTTAISTGVSSRETSRRIRVPVQTPGRTTSRDTSLPARYARSAPTETTILALFDFDGLASCNEQGWTSVDLTTQENYFHVDDFIGLGGGTFGRLIPLEGAQSMWCGARPAPLDIELCQYAALPGYGSGWSQSLTTAVCVPVVGDVRLSYIIGWDTEPAEDISNVQFDTCDGRWNEVRRYDGIGLLRETVVIPDSLHNGQIRVRFLFQSDGAWSDQDGLWDTDGAIIVDSITVEDATGMVLATETFEAEAVGAEATLSGAWIATPFVGIGDFAGLFPGLGVVQEDLCQTMSCLWGFFSGSTDNYACGGFPQQAAVPHSVRIVRHGDTYLANEIRSPVIPNAGTGAGYELQFDVYRDLPLDNLVFYNWSVRSFIAGCPSRWRNDNFVYFGDEKKWITEVFPFGIHVVPGAEAFQVSLGALDMCFAWCGVFGTGGCHSHAPMFDNVEVRRIALAGPQWVVSAEDLFQDAFPADGTVTGTVRADVARNLRTNTPSTGARDTLSLRVSDAEAGNLSADPYTGFGSAVYLMVNVRSPNPGGKSGTALTDNAIRWPVVDSLVAGGDTWYRVRMDTSFNVWSGPRTCPVDDGFCVDLSDDLFTPGDTIRFYFAATSGVGTTFWNEFTGATPNESLVRAAPMEFTCLPAVPVAAAGNILYVDNSDGQGAEPMFETAFDILGLRADRYDVRGTGSEENSPAGRMVDPLVQLAPYDIIVWSSGNRKTGTIFDGSGDPSFADDYALLGTFLDNLDSPGGVYLSGANLASEWASATTISPIVLSANYMSFAVDHVDHSVAGLGVSPLVIGEAGSCFDHFGTRDTLVALGGCPSLASFDVLQPVGASTLEASYFGNGQTGGAIVARQRLNPGLNVVGVVLSGFGFEWVRDDRAHSPTDRVDHLRDIIQWLGGTTGTPTPAGNPPSANALAQNYPNPFNPTTTIKFSLRDRARVTLRIYNAAGQLVRSLVDEVRGPGAEQSVAWDGRNDHSQAVASGVYFYRLTSEQFTQTRKMVLLK